MVSSLTQRPQGRSARNRRDVRRTRLQLEALEDRVCPTLTITPAGQALGLSVSVFATGFPTSGGFGALGAAFPTTGGVLVSDAPGNVRLFPTNADGQSAAAAPIGQSYGNLNAVDVAQVGSAIYLTRF